MDDYTQLRNEIIQHLNDWLADRKLKVADGYGIGCTAYDVVEEIECDARAAASVGKFPWER